MIQNDFNKIIDYCSLVKNDTIKNEVTEILNGYTLYDIDSEKDYINCILKDDSNNKLELIVKKDAIEIFKSNPLKLELITINSDLVMSEKTLEKRPKGAIFSVVSKSFKESSIYKNRTTLTHLIEQRYTFTNDTLNNYFKNHSFSHLFNEIMKSYENTNLENINDYNSTFEIESHLSRNPSTNLLYEEFHTFLNGQDLGNMYNIFNSSTKIYRIYDLYRGLITPRNESDIDIIHDGFSSYKWFNLRESKNLNSEEDNLVGPTTIPISKEYYEYVKKFLKENYGYFGEVAFDRETLLSAITYNMSASELVKRDLARTLGMSYEDFINLDSLKQQELIEQSSRKKGKADVDEKKKEKKSFNDLENKDTEVKGSPFRKVLKLLRK